MMQELVDDQLVELFNKGAVAARAGQPAEALGYYRAILDPRGRDQARPPVVTGDFLGQVHVRIAYCYMDLGRHDAALTQFEEAEPFLTQFDDRTLHDYYYSLANTLGNLGRIDAMDAAFSRALNLAAEELGDVVACYRSWHFLMEHAERARAWEYLAREARAARRFGERNEMPVLVEEAETQLALAERRLKEV